MNLYRFADNMVEAMEEKHMTQVELAIKLGIHVNTVHRWCRGSQAPSAWDLYRTAKYLETTMDKLMEGVE